MASRYSTPTAARRLLALTLRDLRTQSGIEPKDAAKAIERDTTWLNKAERAVMTPSASDIKELLRLYGLKIEDGQAEAILAIARTARKRGGWWHSYADVMPDQFGTFVGLEAAASQIRDFETALVPGLLQTPEYARAVLLAGPIAPTKAAIETTMSVRAERQKILDRDDPPELRVVLDEGLLRREIGGPKVMRAQIEYLIEMSHRPNIKIHILPYGSGAHPGLDGPFILLDFPPPPAGYPTTSDPRVVYLETLANDLYLEKPGELTAYSSAWDGLCGLAYTPGLSERHLRTIADDLSKNI
jgi:Domain of unknown function (DUF5753)/Helix-turn-helix domain